MAQGSITASTAHRQDVGITSPAVRVAILGSLAGGLVLTAGLADPQGVVLFASFAGIGAFLAVRRPRNSMGWLLLMMGWGLGLGSIRCTVPSAALLAGDLDAGQAAIAWSNACGWAFAMAGFLGIALGFPDGRLPGGRARWPARILIVAMVILVVLIVANPVINVTPTDTRVSVDVPNPFAIDALTSPGFRVPNPDMLFPIAFVVVVAGVLSLIVRYRRSVGLAHLQFRWLVAAITFVVIAQLAWAIVYVGLMIDTPVVWLGIAIAYPCIPIAIAFAIQRHRLYEIDRIISRTIAYAVVIAVLAGVFGLGILVLSTVFASAAAGSSIAVAGATLAVCLVAQPALRRIRTVVDRRFDRTRYDTERITTSFTTRLRHETDIETVMLDLVATTRTTVAPTESSVWLRARRNAP
jgi:hypothetical protein